MGRPFTEILRTLLILYVEPFLWAMLQQAREARLPLGCPPLDTETGGCLGKAHSALAANRV